MIKNNLRHLLLDRNMSMRELARQSGLTYSVVYNFATGPGDDRRGFTWSTLDAICKTLDIQPGSILTYEHD